jgi:chromate transporter
MNLADQRRLATGTEGPGSESRPNLRPLLLYFLRLGAVGFGGPIVLAGYMQRDLVDDRRWIARHDYPEGLAFSQLSPGPLAAQLAMYLGWVAGGRIGATLAAIAFVLPSFLMVLVLAALYVHFGRLAWIRERFTGLAPRSLRSSPVALTNSFARLLVRTVCSG